MKIPLRVALLLTLVTVTVRAQINAGEKKPDADLPFTMPTAITIRAQRNCRSATARRS